ncbi:MAG: hypothetical protein IPK35_24250 [Saprospiraceae bacterium]|jgi:hypothetical protein|nr:hypothetical protein [Saprospiraceae bacterium]
MLKESPKKVKIMGKVDKNLTEELKGKQLFVEKLQWAKEFVKDRDIMKELEEADKKARITKP